MASDKVIKRSGKSAKRKGTLRSSKATGGILPIFNGVLFSAAVTVALIMCLAVLLKFGLVKDTVIPIFNQVLKVACIALSAYLGVRGVSNYPWFRGLIAGVIYVILGILVFSLIIGDFSFSLSNLSDIGMAVVIGAIVGFVFGTKPDSKN